MFYKEAYMKNADVKKIDAVTYIRPCHLRFKKKFKEIMLEALSESGFRYDPILNYDLDHPELVYRKKKGDFFIITHKRKIVGTFAIQDMGKGKAYWKRLAILKEYRGNGWGVEAQKYLIDISKNKGFRLAVIDTLKETGMYEKYARFGFKITKECPEGQFTKVFMEKRL